MRFLLTLILFLPLSAFSSADTISIIRGKVYDLSTAEALPAAVVIYDKNQGTITDNNGAYSIKTAPGNISIRFQFLGYKTITRYVKLIPNDTLEINAGMEHEITEIDQIVISANKLEQKVSDLTISMTVVRPEALYNSHITDAQEIINKSSGIEVLDGQASIRGGSGFSYGAGSRVLALIDGLPVLSADAGNIKWQFLPLESLSQIEIIKGASSVLYGSSAINGIINFRTADPGKTPVTRFFAESGVFGKPKEKSWIWWDSPRTFSSASFSHLQRSGKTDIGISTNLLYDNGYRKRNNEKLGRINLKLKHHNKKLEGLTYGLNMNGGFTSKNDFILWDNAENGALKQNESTAQVLNGSFLALDPFISLKKNGRYQHDLRTRLQYSGNDFPTSPQNNSDAFSFYAEYQSWLPLHQNINLIIGLSELLSRVKSEFYGNHQGFNLAGYSQLELNTTKKLKMIAGLRLEMNSLNGTNEQLVPLFRTGLNYKLFNYTFLRASFGQGYRYPSIAEKFAATTLGSVKIFPNPSIRSESGWNSELGVKQGIQTGLWSGQADFAVFYAQNQNMIEYLFSNYEDPVTGIYSFGFRSENVEFSRVYGYELEWMLSSTYRKFHNSVSGGYVFMHPVEFNRATNQNTGEFLKYRRKHSAKLNIASQYSRFEFGLGFYVKSKMLEIDDVFLDPATREDILPGFYDYWMNHNSGYILVDANISCNLKEKYKISLALKNLTNTQYMGRPGDIMPHRNLSLRFAGNF